MTSGSYENYYLVSRTLECQGFNANGSKIKPGNCENAGEGKVIKIVMLFLLVQVTEWSPRENYVEKNANLEISFQLGTKCTMQEEF